MELKVDVPSLAGQNVDPTTFQRVWNRVMPNQTNPNARNDASIPDTAVPAEPSEPPETAAPALPPVPECPARPSLPPVPECPARPSLPPVPECPARPSLPPVPECPPSLPSVPECPACPECPSCPPQQECPACPECPSCPSQQECPAQTQCPPCQTPPSCPPAVCLGEAALEDSQRLEMLMTQAKAGALAGRALVRRSSGFCRKELAVLAADHRLALRRLSAAYFLITGKRYSPKFSAPCLPSTLPLALRYQFGWEQQWEQQNCQAAQATSDRCLKELYLELAQEGAFHAGTIRSILEQMA